MGGWHLRINKRKSFLGGLFTLNFNKKSVSLTTRVGPVHHTRSTNGRHTTTISGPGPTSVRRVSTPASRGETNGRHRRDPSATREERDEARRENLRLRIAARRERIRRINEERHENTRRWREERGQHE